MSISPPFALFVGPTKSGTTWIQAYLESRGDIALPAGVKETFFFDKVYERGFAWYADHFATDAQTKLTAEVAPSLFHKPYACERALRHLPFAKIVCTVRDPFDRAVSHYFHYRKRGAPEMPLRNMASVYPDVIEAGLYAQHAVRWEQAFGPDRVSLVSFQLLRNDPHAFCRELCEILGLDYVAPDPDLVSGRINAAKVPRNLIAARLAHKISGGLRRHGAQRTMGVLKILPIKRWLYSEGAHFAEERKGIKEQSVSFSETMSADWRTFQDRPDFPRETPKTALAQPPA